ncbi:hypothetical protein HBI79_078600 [Parastagonospora nodorum]|nr:hypothetical protein HBI79_078600 [Parastagonospora nodorum]
MSSFKFPPPPPPPPKASSNDNQSPYPSQRGGSSRGRGDGGRGRSSNQRGGGGSFGGGQRGGPANNSRGSPRGGYQNNRGGSAQRGGSRHWQQPNLPIQTSTSNGPNLANGAHMNPPAIDPNTLVQAMSFMATPAGAQSMAAFASHMAGAGNVPFAQPPFQQQTPQQSPRYAPSQQSGQKRKWDERQNDPHAQHQPQRKPQQQGPKPPRAKAAVPPAVPGFGFTLPTPSSAPVPSKSHKTEGNRKGKVRLGLTNHDEKPEESSEEEEIDEEAALGEKLKGGGYAFEHEGEHISLQTAADIAEWIKDRRRNFPTYQKAVEKAQAKAEKRKNELEFVRRLKGKPPQPEPERARPVPKVYERSQRDEKKQEELAALRKKLHESMMKKKEAPTTVDLGLGYGSATESEGESSVLSESSVVSSSEEPSEESDDESDDSDAPPEAISSKIAPPPVKEVPPPVPAQTERKPGRGKMCDNWRQHGKCPFGDGCRYRHPPPKEEKRLGLYEKLVEQELVKSDQLALDAIKYLGQNGFLG